MPVATRARPVPSRTSEIRSAVSAVVRTTSGGTAGSRLRRSAERGEDPVVLGRQPHGDPDRVREAADDEPLRLEPLGKPGGVLRADEDEVRVDRRAVVAGGDERGPHPLPLGDRLARRRAVAARSAAAAIRAAGARDRAPARGGGRARGRSPGERPRSRPAARRARTPSRACGAQSGSAPGRSAARPSCRRIRSRPRRRRPPRPEASGRARRSPPARRSSPVGLFGLQTQTRSASAGLVGDRRALDGARDRVQRVGRAPT